MRDSEILALLGQQLDQSLGYLSGKIPQERRAAFKYYLGEPYGNEVEGRSQVVSQDVLEVIESILPSLLRIFTAMHRLCKLCLYERQSRFSHSLQFIQGCPLAEERLCKALLAGGRKKG